MKPSRWAKPATMARPAKADPDVIRLQDHYLLTYGRARLLKAFSYGLALRHDLLAYLLGDDGAPIRCLGDAFEGIRRRVPRFRPRAIGHSAALYVLEDHGLIAEIRAAMDSIGNAAPDIGHDAVTDAQSSTPFAASNFRGVSDLIGTSSRTRHRLQRKFPSSRAAKPGRHGSA